MERLENKQMRSEMLYRRSDSKEYELLMEIREELKGIRELLE